MVDDSVQFEATGVALDLGKDELDESTGAMMSLGDSGSQNLTQAHTTLGSPPYMSPEQWRYPLSVGPRSDLYSLWVMAYEALTGKQPFTGPTIAAIAEQHLNADVPSVGAQFRAALDRFFQRELAKEPGDRPASALEFARELRMAARLSHLTEAPLTEPVVHLRRAKRRIWPLAAGGGLPLPAAIRAMVCHCECLLQSTSQETLREGVVAGGEQ